MRRSGIAGFRFVPVAEAATLAGARVVRAEGHDLFAVRAESLTQGEVQLRLLERSRLLVGFLLAIALACFIVAAWRDRREMAWRATLVAVGLACVALTPLSAFSNYSRLFDPALYFTPLGYSLTANAAALALTSALVLLLLLAAVRKQARLEARLLAVVIVLVVAGLGPFLLRDLARGIQIPSYGVSASLWLIWEVPLFLAAVSVILAGAAAGSAALGSSRGLPPVVAPSLAAVAAVIAPVVWQAPGQWPWWYTFLWIAAIASLAVSRRSSAVIVAAATVAALGATTLVWGATTRARVRLAEQDVAMLGTGDSYAATLAERLGKRFAEAPVSSRRGLLETYATSDLASAGNPVWLAAWRGAVTPAALLQTVPLNVPMDSLRRLVARAIAERRPIDGELPGIPALEHAIAVPTDSGVVTIIVAPKTRLAPADPFARLLGVETPPEVEPPYTLQIAPLARVPARGTRPSWRREENERAWVTRRPLVGRDAAQLLASGRVPPAQAVLGSTAANGAHRAARPRDRRIAVAHECRGGRRRGTLDRCATSPLGTQLSRASHPGALRVLHGARDRLRHLVVSAAVDRCRAVERAARARDAAVGHSTGERKAGRRLADAREPAPRDAALRVRRRRADDGERLAARGARAGRTTARAGDRSRAAHPR